jgi:hypothetical protein
VVVSVDAPATIETAIVPVAGAGVGVGVGVGVGFVGVDELPPHPIATTAKIVIRPSCNDLIVPFMFPLTVSSFTRQARATIRPSSSSAISAVFRDRRTPRVTRAVRAYER